MNLLRNEVVFDPLKNDKCSHAFLRILSISYVLQALFSKSKHETFFRLDLTYSEFVLCGNC